MDPNYLVCPGEYLQEWMEETGHDEEYVSKNTGIWPHVVVDLIAGRMPVTEPIAASLEHLTSIPKMAWMKYERKYEEERERLAAIGSDGKEGNDGEPRF